MISEIEAGAAKTKQAISDATESVADSAKTQGSRLEKMFRLGMKALPLLPERSLEYFLDRLGLERKRSGGASIALFLGGFAAGSVVTAFATPVSGSQLRKKVRDFTKSVGDGVEEKASELAEAAVSAEKKIVQGAKDLVGVGAKDGATDAKNGIKDVANDVKNGIKDVATDVKNGAKDAYTDVKTGAKDVATDVKNGAKDYSQELKNMQQGIDSRNMGADGHGRNGTGGYRS